MSEPPILFLDVDGVLNCRKSWNDPTTGEGPERIDPAKVVLLNEIVARTGCQIVMSSTWRRVAFCRQTLMSRGVANVFHRDWRTPCDLHVSPGGIILGMARGSEIAAWLTRNPDVTRYAIVDDDSDMLPEQAARFVQTTFDDGLTSGHAELLIELLATPKDPHP